MISLDWNPVAACLVGSWPQQVAAWGREGIAAYLSELEARGVLPDAALTAIRSYDPTADFPPSAARVAQQARRDPSTPTAAEAIHLVRWVLTARATTTKTRYALGERERDDLAAMEARAGECHPLIAGFCRAQGLSRLRRVDLDGEWGEANRARMGAEFDSFTAAWGERGVAALVGPRRAGGLSSLDPLAAIGGRRPELEAGEAEAA